MIAAELDIPVPAISLADVEFFLSDTLQHHTMDAAFSREEKVYELRNKRIYPWSRRMLESSGVVNYDYTNRLPFVALTHIINTLPIEPSSRSVLLIYQKHQPDYDFNFHYDGDKEYGFRICFNLDVDKVFVELAKLQPDYSHMCNNMGKILDHMVDLNKIYQLKPARTNTIFCLNRLQYPHRVPLVNHGPRLVLIVHGLLQQSEFNKLTYIQKIVP
jgi:hypothetical protein